MKKACVYTVADNKNLPYFTAFRNSLRKWHPEEELDILLVKEEEVTRIRDKDFYYRAKPIIGSQLWGKYETLIGMDCDQIVCGDISPLWTEGGYDVGCVYNSNPREAKEVQAQVWDIPHHEYLNAGLVVIKNERFLRHWLGLCHSPHFERYQYREQDLLNILVYYGDYVTKVLDVGPNFWGLASKGYWNQIELRDNQLVLPKNSEYPQTDKIIKVIHWAGGNTVKMNFRAFFKEKEAEWLENLVK